MGIRMTVYAVEVWRGLKGGHSLLYREEFFLYEEAKRYYRELKARLRGMDYEEMVYPRGSGLPASLLSLSCFHLPGGGRIHRRAVLSLRKTQYRWSPQHLLEVLWERPEGGMAALEKVLRGIDGHTFARFLRELEPWDVVETLSLVVKPGLHHLLEGDWYRSFLHQTPRGWTLQERWMGSPHLLPHLPHPVLIRLARAMNASSRRWLVEAVGRYLPDEVLVEALKDTRGQEALKAARRILWERRARLVEETLRERGYGLPDPDPKRVFSLGFPLEDPLPKILWREEVAVVALGGGVFNLSLPGGVVRFFIRPDERPFTQPEAILEGEELERAVGRALGLPPALVVLLLRAPKEAILPALKGARGWKGEKVAALEGLPEEIREEAYRLLTAHALLGM